MALFKEGDSGEDVKRVQQALKEKVSIRVRLTENSGRERKRRRPVFKKAKD